MRLSLHESHDFSTPTSSFDMCITLTVRLSNRRRGNDHPPSHVCSTKHAAHLRLPVRGTLIFPCATSTSVLFRLYQMQSHSHGCTQSAQKSWKLEQKRTEIDPTLPRLQNLPPSPRIYRCEYLHANSYI